MPVPPDPSSTPDATGPLPGWRGRLHEIIFEADTPGGKAFDVALLVAILLSVAAVMLESVEGIGLRWATPLTVFEWIFTILFTVEYVLRLICVRRAAGYAFSFFGIVDLLAILPTYVSLLFTGAAPLIVIRLLRMLRIFRIFKLGHFLSEASMLRQAVWASRAKVTVFLATVLILVVIMGAAMHLIEDDNPGFDSIPDSMYWAIVTMTTVGYGDVAPQSTPGRMLAAIVMVLGYSFIIIPTGIVSAELAHAAARPISTQVCPSCSREGHDLDASFCKFCGGAM